MSGYGRRGNDAHESYYINPNISLPFPSSHGDGHDFEASSYHFPQHQFGPYASHFSLPYSHTSLLSHHSSGASIPPVSDHGSLHHTATQCMPQPRCLQGPVYLPLHEALAETGFESQESRNEDTMLSEPIIPPLEGFPNVQEFDKLVKSYVDDLSVKKQDKALIHARRAQNIKTVLIDPKDTAIESAQFRFWVKKMFKLQAVGGNAPDCTKMICHEGKPVAIREKLFKILTKAHQQCQHGGRDKTSAQVRQIYSWVPKELISRFVKICPACQVRRGGTRLTPPTSRRSSPPLEIRSRSPKPPPPPSSRRQSGIPGAACLERPQIDYFNQQDSRIDLGPKPHRQTRLGIGAVRPPNSGVQRHIPGSIPPPLDLFHHDLPVPSLQVYYGTGYGAVHGSSSRRDFSC
ncbi:integrase zinc binding domain-containing protein [Aspergillus lucknowensis]|uniref:Integrase zinc-binding domain-containing protein n=1 Tax=Aspergillus lucknowensis TaxID=176173 RepID=A0ABR4LFY4_9EURO